MKKIFLLFAIFSTFTFSRGYIEEYKRGLEREKTISRLFSAIKTKNNVYAEALLSPKANVNKASYNIPSEKEENKVELDVNVVDKKGFTPVLICAMYNNVDMLKEIIKKGANLEALHPILGKTLLVTAIFYGSNDVAKFLIENRKELINKGSNTDGWLPIEEAVLQENKDILLLLLRHGAIIRKKDKNGYDVYDLATRHGKGTMVKILRDYELGKLK
ncbi:ankyrin repeat domain-containing protein [Sneathia vaginalis]|uniref:ankyrin repeat domain-containing protein n=1 Tax=Sneathia vaginalis TaxID=187101 RepID=UPI00069689A9|nr:ankyrin repeat domain-containing protein [Sneathia vaginalis]